MRNVYIFQILIDSVFIFGVPLRFGRRATITAAIRSSPPRCNNSYNRKTVTQKPRPSRRDGFVVLGGWRPISRPAVNVNNAHDRYDNTNYAPLSDTLPQFLRPFPRGKSSSSRKISRAHNIHLHNTHNFESAGPQLFPRQILSYFLFNSRCMCTLLISAI